MADKSKDLDFNAPPIHVTETQRETETPGAPLLFKRRGTGTAVSPEPEPSPAQTRTVAAVLSGWATWFQAAWARLTKVHTAVLFFVVGSVFGLTALGWWLWPVQYEAAQFQHLAYDEQALVIQMTADLYSYELDPTRIGRVFDSWANGDELVCAMAANTDDFWERARLISIAAVRNGVGCE